jgi:hypothetical protein
MESLENLTPSFVKEFNLIYLNEHIINLKDEFTIWLDEKCRSSRFILANEELLKICYAIFVEDSIEYVKNVHKSVLKN